MTIALELPALPVAHARALAMLSRHDASAAELAAIVESDPALTAAVLRASNSAAYAPISRIRTANNGVVRIGLSMTRRIIAGAALGRAFQQMNRSQLDVDEMWRHVLACALIADATAWTGGPRTEAFTAGMLHDVGRLALAAQQPEQYAQVVALVQGGADPAEAEQRIFGCDHVTWGVEVGRAWDFPDAVVEAIAGHHDGSHGALAWVTWNARQVVARLGIGDGLVPGTPVQIERPDDQAIVEAAGGVDGLMRQVEWYRGAVTTVAA